MNQDEEKYIIAITSAPQDDAENIARAIIDEKLAACVQILGPATSFYWWKGEVQKDAEAIMLLKTKECRIQEIKQRIESIHPYDIPELLFLPILDGLPGYFDWINTVVADNR